jgi:hypothetical protein
MRTAHAHSAAATAHTHGAAAAEMNATATATATEVSSATSTTEVTAASTAAAEMSPTSPTAAASGISNSRQTKRKAYCGRACCDFPHDTTSSSGPNAESQRQIARSVPAEPKLTMLQCTRRRSALHASIDMWVNWQAR